MFKTPMSGIDAVFPRACAAYPLMASIARPARCGAKAPKCCC